ncbi:sugar transporter stl1 [Pyrenophora seminiperda CCB06]|uniref:Sugar transporter stl1 n=1 Tax=Pyrenophora seminiperda CCB06 TaxID=1302712 RepID=A0A3M7MBP5_9PLEO|nr:sugar transporter stl1 [Pyrenophora seminiperda CCB06]
MIHCVEYSTLVHYDYTMIIHTVKPSQLLASLASKTNNMDALTSSVPALVIVTLYTTVTPSSAIAFVTSASQTLTTAVRSTVRQSSVAPVSTLSTLISSSSASVSTLTSSVSTLTPSASTSTSSVISISPSSSATGAPAKHQPWNDTTARLFTALLILLAVLLLAMVSYMIYFCLRGKCPHCRDLQDQLDRWQSGDLQRITPAMVRQREAFNKAAAASSSKASSDIEMGPIGEAAAARAEASVSSDDSVPTFWNRARGRLSRKDKGKAPARDVEIVANLEAAFDGAGPSISASPVRPFSPLDYQPNFNHLYQPQVSTYAPSSIYSRPTATAPVNGDRESRVFSDYDPNDFNSQRRRPLRTEADESSRYTAIVVAEKEQRLQAAEKALQSDEYKQAEFILRRGTASEDRLRRALSIVNFTEQSYNMARHPSMYSGSATPPSKLEREQPQGEPAQVEQYEMFPWRRNGHNVPELRFISGLSVSPSLLVLGDIEIVSLIWVPATLLCCMPWVQKQMLYLHNITFFPGKWLTEPERAGFLSASKADIAKPSDNILTRVENQVVPFRITTKDQKRLFVWLVTPLGVYARNADSFIQEKTGTDIEDSVAWSSLCNDPEARLLIYFHGNSATLAQERRTIEYRSYSAGASEKIYVLAFDYRGFGLSEGDPSESGLLDDAEAVVDWALNTSRIPPERIVLLGHSLGTAVVSGVAHRYATTLGIEFAGLILCAAFTNAGNAFSSYSIGGVVPVLAPVKLFPVLQAWFTRRMVDTWRSDNRLATMARTCSGFKLVLVHAQSDTTMPWHETEALFQSTLRAAKDASPGDDDLKGIETVDLGEAGRQEIWRSNSRSISKTIAKHGGHNTSMTWAPVALTVLQVFRLAASPVHSPLFSTFCITYFPVASILCVLFQPARLFAGIDIAVTQPQGRSRVLAQRKKRYTVKIMPAIAHLQARFLEATNSGGVSATAIALIVVLGILPVIVLFWAVCFLFWAYPNDRNWCCMRRKRRPEPESVLTQAPMTEKTMHEGPGMTLPQQPTSAQLRQESGSPSNAARLQKSQRQSSWTQNRARASMQSFGSANGQMVQEPQRFV